VLKFSRALRHLRTVFPGSGLDHANLPDSLCPDVQVVHDAIGSAPWQRMEFVFEQVPCEGEGGIVGIPPAGTGATLTRATEIIVVPYLHAYFSLQGPSGSLIRVIFSHMSGSSSNPAVAFLPTPGPEYHMVLPRPVVIPPNASLLVQGVNGDMGNQMVVNAWYFRARLGENPWVPG
jgi:hypothetical protein